MRRYFYIIIFSLFFIANSAYANKIEPFLMYEWGVGFDEVKTDNKSDEFYDYQTNSGDLRESLILLGQKCEVAYVFHEGKLMCVAITFDTSNLNVEDGNKIVLEADKLIMDQVANARYVVNEKVNGFFRIVEDEKNYIYIYMTFRNDIINVVAEFYDREDSANLKLKEQFNEAWQESKTNPESPYKNGCK